MTVKTDPARLSDLTPGEELSAARVIANASASWTRAEDFRMRRPNDDFFKLYQPFGIGFGSFALFGVFIAFMNMGVGHTGDGFTFLFWSLLGCFGLLGPVFWNINARQNRKWRQRIVTVEGDTVAAYVSDNFKDGEGTADLAAGTLVVWPVWRLPLVEADRLEIGPAADFIADFKSIYQNVSDVFTMWRGNRVVFYRYDHLVADGMTAARFALLEMIEAAKAARTSAAPAAAPAAAPSPSTQEPGFSL